MRVGQGHRVALDRGGPGRRRSRAVGVPGWSSPAGRCRRRPGPARVPGTRRVRSRVVRDAAGIAHITARHAARPVLRPGLRPRQERMWQMEVWRHISAGRLAELFGAEPARHRPLHPDARLAHRRAARPRRLRAGHARRPRRLRRRASTPGSTATAARSGSRSWPAGDTPEPWTDLDTVAWGKVQAWNLGGNFDTEVFRYLADATLGDPARTDELFPAYRDGAPVITPTGLPGSAGAGSDGAATAQARSTTGPATATGVTPVGPVRDRSTPRTPPPGGRWPSSGRRPSGVAGLDEADGLAVGPRDRLERLGRRAVDVGQRRRAAGQRPAPRDLDAVDLVHERPALPDGRRGLSVRRGRGVLPGRPGRGPRPQRPDRLGRHERRPRRPGPRHRDRRSRPIRPITSTRASPSRSTVRHEKIKVKGGDTGRPGGPLDAARADPQRRRGQARRRAADGPALDRHPGHRPHGSRRSWASTRRQLR